METAHDFAVRVLALTGYPLAALPDGEGEDLLGGSIVARRGATYVVTYGYESSRVATDYRVIDREGDLPARTVVAESEADAASVAALSDLVDLLRPVARSLSVPLIVGRSDWQGDAPLTYDGEGLVLYHDTWNDETTRHGSDGCGETRGYLLALRPDGSMIASDTHGRYWSGGGGGSLWETDGLSPVTLADAARRLDVEHVLRRVWVMLASRRGRARELAWRRQRVSKALRAVEVSL